MPAPAPRASTSAATTSARSRQVRVAIIGAGFSGLGMAIQLQRHGITDFVVLERASDVGGTWRDNTYPGCACDIPSALYSFSFAPYPGWTRTFAPQPEIQDYLKRCADAVRAHLRFGCELLQACWDDTSQRWQLETSGGPLTASVLILGQGPLSEPALPTIPGIERFDGPVFHSARWEHSVRFAGRRVAVVGTGASAIQFVPRLQPHVAQLDLYQRTPPWLLPRLDRAIPPDRQALFRRVPIAQRLVRAGTYWKREISVLGLVYQPALLRSAERQALKHLRAQVASPDLRAKLTPSYTIGCKRILLSDDFYPAVTQPNVSVITDRITRVSEHRIVTTDGTERPADAIIFATGFRVTDMPVASRITGRNGTTLADTWQGGPAAYLGITVAGYPNLFLLIGPNTGLGHNSMVYMIESQIAYIVGCLRAMDARHLRSIEVDTQRQRAYIEEMRRRMRGTAWTSGCTSWYLDASGHNTSLWPGFTWEYRLRTRRCDIQHYRLVTDAGRPDAVPTPAPASGGDTPAGAAPA